MKTTIWDPVNLKQSDLTPLSEYPAPEEIELLAYEWMTLPYPMIRRHPKGAIPKLLRAVDQVPNMAASVTFP